MSDLRETRIAKAAALRKVGREPYAIGFQPTSTAAKLQLEHKDLANGQERDVEVCLAGRVLARRVMGKLAFFTLSDETGTIQLYLEKATLDQNFVKQEGKSSFSQLTELVDTGDWIGVVGILRRTDRGELSVKVYSWTMLCKSLQMLYIF